MVPLFARRIGDVGGKRKLDDWSMERNSSRASDDVALELAFSQAHFERIKRLIGRSVAIASCGE